MRLSVRRRITHPTDIVHEAINASFEYVLILIVTADAKFMGARDVDEVTG